MSKNILLTVAGGFIGGSILADFAFRASGPIIKDNITAVVRSREQVLNLAKLGVNVVQVDLKHELAVAQSSIAAMFSEEGGWYPGQVNDTDSLYELEKQVSGPNPVRETHTLLTEQGKAEGVKTYITALSCVYGTGTGEIRKLSISMPLYVRTSIAQKRVYKVEENGWPPAVHISDLVALYALITVKVVQDQPVPSGEEGYFLVVAYKIDWWEVMDSIAKHLSARGLVDGPEVHTWPTWEAAASGLKLPPSFAKSITASS
ncbi:hypothetical protein ACHAQH_006188 [Verticillium albo-atrum]